MWYVHCVRFPTISSILAAFTLAVLSACLATDTHSQSLDSVLNLADKAKLDLLATLTVQKLREAQLTEEPKVLVIDFFRSSTFFPGSAGTSALAHCLLTASPNL
jgi:hypothetical protein